MALKTYRPTTPTRRFTVLVTNEEITTKKPEKSLLAYKKYNAGRNNGGRLTVRHKGGRAKRHYRIIDFKRDKHNIPGIVKTIEYDPFRTSYIALIQYADGEKRYILAPVGLKVGDEVQAGDKVAIQVGNALPLKNIPAAMFVHNIELIPGNGGIMVRSAGAGAQIQGGAKGYIQIKMPSGEIRLVKENCYATIGTLSNLENKNEKLGKAGRKRKMGVKPTVRGTAMSGGKHPHGDGQGKSGRHGPGGPAKDRWGNRIGRNTRNRPNTNKFILKRRPNKRGKKHKKYKTII